MDKFKKVYEHTKEQNQDSNKKSTKPVLCDMGDYIEYMRTRPMPIYDSDPDDDSVPDLIDEIGNICNDKCNEECINKHIKKSTKPLTHNSIDEYLKSELTSETKN